MAVIDIRNFGGDASGLSVGFGAAVESGLVGLWFFNRGVQESRHSLAVGGADAAIVGSPSSQGAFLRFKGNENYLQTGVADTEAFTHIVVAKSADTLAGSAHSPMFISNFGSGPKVPTGAASESSAGAAIFSSSSAANVTMSASRFTNDTNTTVTSLGVAIAATVASWNMLASRTRADRTQRNNLTTGVTTAANFTTQSRVLGAGAFRIGSSYSSSWGGEADIAAIAMYNRFLTDTELDAMRDQIRDVMSFFGITT